MYTEVMYYQNYHTAHSYKFKSRPRERDALLNDNIDKDKLYTINRTASRYWSLLNCFSQVVHISYYLVGCLANMYHLCCGLIVSYWLTHFLSHLSVSPEQGLVWKCDTIFCLGCQTTVRAKLFKTILTHYTSGVLNRGSDLLLANVKI